MSPAICFICENSPTQEAERVIDTTREFNPECLTRLSGRKYVCEGCATEMGRAMGQVSYESFVDLTEQAAESAVEVEGLKAEVEQLKNEQHVVVDPNAMNGAFFAKFVEALDARDAEKAPAGRRIIHPVNDGGNAS